MRSAEIRVSRSLLFCLLSRALPLLSSLSLPPSTLTSWTSTKSSSSLVSCPMLPKAAFSSFTSIVPLPACRFVGLIVVVWGGGVCSAAAVVQQQRTQRRRPTRKQSAARAGFSSRLLNLPTLTITKHARTVLVKAVEGLAAQQHLLFRQISCRLGHYCRVVSLSQQVQDLGRGCLGESLRCISLIYLQARGRVWRSVARV